MGSDPTGIYMGGCFTPRPVQGFLSDRFSDHGMLVAQSMHTPDSSGDDWMQCCLSWGRRRMGSNPTGIYMGVILLRYIMGFC